MAPVWGRERNESTCREVGGGGGEKSWHMYGGRRGGGEKCLHL